MVYYQTSNLDIEKKQRRTASERKDASETYQHEFHFGVFLNWSWTRLLKKKKCLRISRHVEPNVIDYEKE